MLANSKDQIDRLTTSVLQQAKLFLEEADEFYPFATVLDKNKNIKPIGIYWGDEFPDASEVLLKLEDAVRNGIVKNDYLVAAVAVNVYINIESSNGPVKRDALEIRLHEQNTTSISYYLYFKSNGQFLFEQASPVVN